MLPSAITRSHPISPNTLTHCLTTVKIEKSQDTQKMLKAFGAHGRLRSRFWRGWQIPAAWWTVALRGAGTDVTASDKFWDVPPGARSLHIGPPTTRTFTPQHRLRRSPSFTALKPSGPSSETPSSTTLNTKTHQFTNSRYTTRPHLKLTAHYQTTNTPPLAQSSYLDTLLHHQHYIR